jgi:hypothetical protein
MLKSPSVVFTEGLNRIPSKVLSQMDKSSLVPVVGWRTHFSGPSKLILKIITSRLLLYLSFVNNFLCFV